MPGTIGSVLFKENRNVGPKQVAKNRSKMIEVFKTNVEEACHARNVIALLLQHFPKARINFDLHDCDKILRVEGDNFAVEKIISVVTENGFSCSALE